MKKIVSIITGILCLALCIGCFIACDGDGNGDGSGSGGVNNYTMEAEYIDLDGVNGAGVSGEATGVNMIYGNGSDAHKAKGWSGGYYVGYTYSPDLALDFVFASDSDAAATIILRLGSELGNLTLDSNSFAVKVNGTAIPYSGMFVSGSPSMPEMSFADKTVTTSAQFVKGGNIVSLVVLNNALRDGQIGAPMIDCVKFKTSAKLTWVDKTGNPGGKGDI